MCNSYTSDAYVCMYDTSIVYDTIYVYIWNHLCIVCALYPM